MAFVAYGKTGIGSARQYGHGDTGVIFLVGKIDGHFGSPVIRPAVVVGIAVGP